MELNVINEKIATLRTAEGQIKGLVGELAVAVMQRVHNDNDVDSANNMLAVLTPANKRKATIFFQTFSGHTMNEGKLGKRKKVTMKDGVSIDHYQASKDAFSTFMNSKDTFWTWQKKQGESQVSPLDKAIRAAKTAKKLIDEARKNGVLTNIQSFELLTGSLFEPADMLNILGAMARIEEVQAKAMAPEQLKEAA